MRLDKYISNCGIAARSAVKKLVKNGVVTVNGAIIKKADTDIKENDIVCVNGKEIRYREFVYIMLNKPQGCVSATEDKEHQTVIDLITDDEYSHFKLFPVGRLDIDTEGLLILTNDGAFAHELTSPKKNIYKTYLAKLDRPAEEADIKTFASGMEFKDFTAKNAVLEMTNAPDKVLIKISEGKFHQVKRMCERVGKKVLYLKRIAIGSLSIDNSLSPGEYRELTSDEMKLLYM